MQSPNRMWFPKVQKLGSSVKVRVKRRGQNRVRIFMRLPLKVARWAGVYLPLPKYSLKLCVYRIIITLLAYCFVFTWGNKDITFKVSNVIDLVSDIIRGVLVAVILMETLRKGKYLVDAFRKLDDVERGLATLGKLPLSNTRLVRSLLVRLALTSGAMLGGFAKQCKTHRLSILFMTQHALMFMIMFYFYATWLVVMGILSMVDQQFVFLTRRLGVLSVSSKTKDKTLAEHRLLVKYHSHICSAVDDVGVWFELCFLLYAGVQFFTTTFGVYIMSLGALKMYRYPSWCRSIDLMANILLFVLRAHEIWEVIQFSSRVEKNSVEFSNRLHEVLIAAGERAEGIFKLHFALKPKVELWACGFFRIDNSLTFSMIATAATYLAVVYQSIDLSNENFSRRPKSNSSG